MKKILSVMIAGLLLLASACSGFKQPNEPNNPNNPTTGTDITATDIVLAENGETAYKIVIPQNADEAVTDAAKKLSAVFQEATGASISISENGATGLDETAAVISLGETQILQDAISEKKIGIALTQENLNRHGYVIKRCGKTVVIAAAVSEGVYYGALEFLNRQFKYETYSADEIYFETVTKSLLLDYDLVDIPSFAGRDIDGYTDFYADYAKDLRLTRNFGAVKQIPSDCHALYKYFDEPAKRGEDGEYLYFESSAEPERPCITNVNTFNSTIRKAKEFLIADPDADFLNVSEEDMQKYCRGQTHKESDGSSTCTCATDFAKYGISGVWMRFLNKIIPVLEEWRKDPIADYENDPSAPTAVEITEEQAQAIKDGHWNYTTFAYGSNSLPAPVTADEDGNVSPKDPSVVPHEKLYVKLAPLDIMCIDHAFNDEDCTRNKQNVYNQFKNWKTLTDHYLTWSYLTNYRDYLMYVPYVNSVQENARVYKEMGVYNYFVQSHTLSRYSNMYALNYYLFAKTAWNVDADLSKLVSDFMMHYYKDAAAAMTGYMDYMNTWCAVKELHHGNYTNFDASYYPRAVLEKAMEYINSAFASIEHYKTDDLSMYNRLYKRIVFEKVCTRYMLLKGYSEYYSAQTAATQGMQWLNEMREDLKILGNFKYAEVYTKTMDAACTEFETMLKGLM